MKQQKSFTLIEILVVIVVIGVLSAFILVGMSSISSKANIAKGQTFVNSLDNSLLLARVSQWKLDDRPNIAPFTISDSWGSNAGTLMDVDGNCSTTKCPQLVTSGCSSGNCLSFDGTDDYIDCGNNSILDTVFDSDYTVSAWIKSSSSNTNKPIWSSLDTNNGYRLVYFNSPNVGQVKFYSGTSSGSLALDSITTGLNNNQWHHFIFLLNGTIQKIYIDGVFDNSRTKISATAPSDSNFYISKYSTLYFNGLIDDVRIYNQAISTSEIQQNYYIGLNKLLLNNGIGVMEYTNRLAEVK